MYHSAQPFTPRSRRADLPPDIVSPLLTMELPRGKQDVHIRLTCFPDGCRALELQDADRRGFYWPTMPVCRITLAELLPPELGDALVVAVKPSAVRNGMAQALVDSGILLDLGIEMPSDRYFVRLMQVHEPLLMPPPAAEPEGGRVALALLPPAVPQRWEAHVKRIRAAFARRGMDIGEADAMLAWAIGAGAIAREPPRLPGSGEEIVSMLRPLLKEQ